MKIRNSRSTGKVGQAFSRLGVLGGAGACGALLFRLPGVGGIGACLLPTLFILAGVIGIVSNSRVQARRRWKAAWDAYAEMEMSGEPISIAVQNPTYSLAGAH